jgi:sulfide:quinone oxidoreductase
MPNTIVILGGGTAGLVAANELRRRLPAKHRVVLVDKSEWHLYAPSFLWVMTGERTPAQARVPLATLLARGVEFQQAEVTVVDTKGCWVETSTGAIAYDRLVIALGAQLAPESLEGLAEASHTFYTLEGAARLREALGGITRGRIAVVVASMPYKCPGAPHEGAMLIADQFRRRGLSNQVHVDLYTPEPQPMPVAGPRLGEAVKSMLASRGIGFHPVHKLLSVNPDNRQLVFDGGVTTGYDLLVAIPPHRAPAALAESGLLSKAGWVTVDPHTLATPLSGVYAIGDIAGIPIPGRWKPDVPLVLPKAGVFAHAQGLIAAERIAAEVTGQPAQASFEGDGYCMLESGAGEAGFAFGNFFAEPAPEVQLRQIGKGWHWGKVLFEKWWLAPPGPKRAALGWALKAGGRAYGIPIEL